MRELAVCGHGNDKRMTKARHNHHSMAVQTKRSHRKDARFDVWSEVDHAPRLLAHGDGGGGQWWGSVLRAATSDCGRRHILGHDCRSDFVPRLVRKKRTASVHTSRTVKESKHRARTDGPPAGLGSLDGALASHFFFRVAKTMRKFSNVIVSEHVNFV